MSLRATFFALFVTFGVFAAGIATMVFFFGREAEMREAQLAFETRHADKIRATRDAFAAANVSDEDTEFVTHGADFVEEAPELDDWYASAGSASEPFDPTPEDTSWLINDAEPIE